MALHFKMDCLHSLHGRWITLIVSFLEMAVFGTDHSYTAYTQDLKQLYNLTQRQCKYIFKNAIFIIPVGTRYCLNIS